MIKSRNIDYNDVHKMHSIAFSLGNITSTSEISVAQFVANFKGNLAGYAVNVVSASGTSPTLRIRVLDGATVLADNGASGTALSTTANTPTAFQQVGSGSISGSIAALDSDISALPQILRADTLTIKATMGGSASPTANNVTVILFFQ